jgi:hypothetical protein
VGNALREASFSQTEGEGTSERMTFRPQCRPQERRNSKAGLLIYGAGTSRLGATLCRCELGSQESENLTRGSGEVLLISASAKMYASWPPKPMDFTPEASRVK